MFSLADKIRPTWRRAVLATLAIVWCGSLALVWHEPKSHVLGPKKATPSDLDMHEAVVERMQNGESYYQALGRELHGRGYPTGSAFNWRMPQPLWLVARLPNAVWGRALLSLLATILLLWAAATLLRDAGRIGALCGVVALTGAVLPCYLGSLYLSHLLWSSVLVGLSLCADAWQRHALAVVLGILAALCRELAVGYCLVAAVLAYREGRSRIFTAWCIGLLVVVLAIIAHMQSVMVSGWADSVSIDTRMWWHLKSPYFLVRCAQAHGFLLLLPGWVAYVYLSAACVGLAACRTDWGRRAKWSVAGYLVALLFVGQEVNDYWGTLLTTPLAMGLAFGPEAVRSLRNWLEATNASPTSLPSSTSFT